MSSQNTAQNMAPIMIAQQPQQQSQQQVQTSGQVRHIFEHSNLTFMGIAVPQMYNNP